MSENRQPSREEQIAAQMRATALLAELDRTEAEIRTQRSELVTAQVLLTLAKAECDQQQSTQSE